MTDALDLATRRLGIALGSVASALALAPRSLADPGDAGSLNNVAGNDVSYSLTAGTSAQTRTVAQPTGPDQRMSIVLGTAGTSYITLTITGGYNAAGDTSLVMFQAGDSVFLRSVDVGGTYYWRTLEPPNLGMWRDCPSRALPNFHALVHELYDDFTSLDTNWTVTEDDAACTQAVTDNVCGTLLMTCKAATDNNGHQVQYAQETFKLVAGKTLWFETKVKAAARKAGAAPEIDLVIGLIAAEDMTGVADNQAADGVNFHIIESDTEFRIVASKNGTHTGAVTSTTNLGTGYHTLGLLIDGVTSITPYIDGVPQTALTATICDDEELSPIFMVRNGDGTITQTLEIDYVRVCQLR